MPSAWAAVGAASAARRAAAAAAMVRAILMCHSFRPGPPDRADARSGAVYENVSISFAGRTRLCGRPRAGENPMRRTADHITLHGMTTLETLLRDRLTSAFTAVAGSPADPSVRRSQRADFQADGALALARPL